MSRGHPHSSLYPEPRLRYDEIALDPKAETCGGRLGHETPEGLLAKPKTNVSCC